jgi:hypothetical protein
MNQDKAREFFSALYEGNLEPGLRYSLETRLRNDPGLQADYSAFASTMDDLQTLPNEEIEVPIYLSDRIATRLEQEMARRSVGRPIWGSLIRGVIFAGLAGAALIGAVLSMRSSGATSVANPFPTAAQDQPSFSVNGSSVLLNFRPGASKTVVVSSAMTDREIQRFVVDGTSPAHPFENKLAGTAVFDVQVLGDSPAYILALPGAVDDGGSTTGKPATVGTVRDLAAALAHRYRLPVVVHAADTSKRLSWNLEGLDPNRAAASALAGEPYVVDQRESGILYISDR